MTEKRVQRDSIEITSKIHRFWGLPGPDAEPDLCGLKEHAGDPINNLVVDSCRPGGSETGRLDFSGLVD